jgi:hypothetical protein
MKARIIHTLRIRRRGNGGKQFHVANVVHVDLVLEHDDEPFPVEPDGENGGREGELADG